MKSDEALVSKGYIETLIALQAEYSQFKYDLESKFQAIEAVLITSKHLQGRVVECSSKFDEVIRQASTKLRALGPFFFKVRSDQLIFLFDASYIFFLL